MKKIMLLIMLLLVSSCSTNNEVTVNKQLDFTYKTNIGYFFKDDSGMNYLYEDELDENSLLKTSGVIYMYVGEEMTENDYFSYIDNELVHYNKIDNDELQTLILE